MSSIINQGETLICQICQPVFVTDTHQPKITNKSTWTPEESEKNCFRKSSKKAPFVEIVVSCYLEIGVTKGWRNPGRWWKVGKWWWLNGWIGQIYYHHNVYIYICILRGGVRVSTGTLKFPAWNFLLKPYPAITLRLISFLFFPHRVAGNSFIVGWKVLFGSDGAFVGSTWAMKDP